MFRIEVQADSIPQLADQLLALGMQMSATTAAVAFPQRDTIYVAADKITAGDPVKRTRAPNKAKAEAVLSRTEQGGRNSGVADPARPLL